MYVSFMYMYLPEFHLTILSGAQTVDFVHLFQDRLTKWRLEREGGREEGRERGRESGWVGGGDGGEGEGARERPLNEAGSGTPVSG